VQGDSGLDVGALPPRVPPRGEGGRMKKFADYTIGVVIVLVHLVIMSWRNEKLGLDAAASR
jgi:hypothetical protein